jgi:hypothetical protein
VLSGLGLRGGDTVLVEALPDVGLRPGADRPRDVQARPVLSRNGSLGRSMADDLIAEQRPEAGRE